MDRNQNSNPYGNSYNENPYGNTNNSNLYGNSYNENPYINPGNGSSYENPYNDASYRNSAYNNPYGSFETNNPYGNPYQAQESAVYGAEMDERVSSILTKSFLYMFIALCLSAMAAEAVNYCLRFGIIPWENFFTLMAVAGIAELVLVLIGNSVLLKGNVKAGGILLTVYSILNGITLSSVLLVYGAVTVTSTFISTALVFGVMAFIGIVSKKDFGTWGRIGIMLLLGVLVITTVNIFILKSSGLDLLTSIAGLVIFIGLTAYDSQRIKKMAMAYSGGGNTDTVIAMSGALQLYLDFINIFLYLLKIFGKRSR